MKAFWRQQAGRINARTLRERTIMFASLAVAMAAAADALVLSPQLAEQRALGGLMHQQTTDLASLRKQLGSSGAAAPADSPQGRLLAVRKERAAVDADIRQRSTGSAAATRLPDLLAQVLRRHDRLTLLRLATAIPVAAPVAAPVAVNDGEAATLPQLGVDLSLAGSYPDLAAYLAEIETTLPGVRWSDLQISSQEQPPVLKVRVYLLGDFGVGP